MVGVPDGSGPLHTPAEMQQMSDLAHWIEGGVLMLAAALALWGAFSRSRATGNGIPPRGESASWATVLLAAGIILTFYLVFPHHGLDRTRAQWDFVFGDPQQRQHVFIATLLIVGSAIEVLYRTRAGFPRLLAYVWPVSVLLIGLLFAVHAQHGTSEAVARAVAIHRALGVFFVAVALTRSAQLLIGADMAPKRAVHHWLAFGWPALLLIASVLLVSYREPAGAFETEHGAGHGSGAANQGSPSN